MTEIWDIYFYQNGERVDIAEAASVDGIHLAVHVLRQEKEIPADVKVIAQKQGSDSTDYPDQIIIDPR